MNMLYIGDLWYGSTALWRYNAFEELHYKITKIDSTKPKNWLIRKIYNLYQKKYKRGIDLIGLNSKILAATRKNSFDIVWIDKGINISPKTLQKIKKQDSKVKLISFSPDDMFNPINQTTNYLDSLSYYDWIVTTKSHNIKEFELLGFENTIYVQKSFQPKIHKPIALSESEQKELATDVGFIGNFEQARFKSMLYLAEHNIKVHIKGKHWHSYIGYHKNLIIDAKDYNGTQYAKAINATKINLGFLHKGNRDKHTARSIEIPACGAFLLAERTNEHLSLFEEDVEAAFFDSDEELLKKITYYLSNDEKVKMIAKKGLERCLKSGYDNKSVFQKVLLHI